MTSEIIQAALASYEQGDPRAALQLLQFHRIADGTAVMDYVDLAIDRLRRETGENVIAVMPVGFALRTALGLFRDGMAEVMCPDPGAIDC
jgi:hypothetical protein